MRKKGDLKRNVKNNLKRSTRKQIFSTRPPLNITDPTGKNMDSHGDP